MNNEKHHPPVFAEYKFHCPLCGAFANQYWDYLYDCYHYACHDFSYSECNRCKKRCYWYKKNMIVPPKTTTPLPNQITAPLLNQITAPLPNQITASPPHQDLPQSCIADYNVARDIFARSPKAAAAMLRLVTQKLLFELGESGKNIKNDIRSLVAKGIPVAITQALDYCRVVGNNAVHPGEIDLNDNPQMTSDLFEMINFIVEVMISRPKKLAALYNSHQNGFASDKERDKTK